MKTILLVDDEAAIRRLVEITLGGAARYHLVHAADGAQALRAASEVAIDVALLDLSMPVMDGFRACQALTRLPGGHRPRVVILSALNSPADQARAMAAGADRFLAKPFSPLALLECLARLTDGPRPTAGRAASRPDAERPAGGRAGDSRLPQRDRPADPRALGSPALPRRRPLPAGVGSLSA